MTSKVSWGLSTACQVPAFGIGLFTSPLKMPLAKICHTPSADMQPIDEGQLTSISCPAGSLKNPIPKLGSSIPLKRTVVVELLPGMSGKEKLRVGPVSPLSKCGVIV